MVNTINRMVVLLPELVFPVIGIVLCEVFEHVEQPFFPAFRTFLDGVKDAGGSVFLEVTQYLG